MGQQGLLLPAMVEFKALALAKGVMQLLPDVIFNFPPSSSSEGRVGASLVAACLDVLEYEGKLEELYVVVRHVDAWQCCFQHGEVVSVRTFHHVLGS